MDNWVYLIILGLIAGIIGKFVMPGKDPGGLIITILIGVAGAFLGSFIGQKLGWGGITGGFDIKNIGLAVGGVVVLLFLFRLIRKKD